MPTHIQSVHNDRIKRAVRLRDRRGRQQQERIIIDGCREVRRALQSGIRPVEMFVSDACAHEPEIESIMAMLAPADTDPTLVTSGVFEKLAFGNRADGIVMIAAEPHQRLDQLQLENDALICVLERLEKPGNLGAVLRTADATGLAAVIVADGCTDLYNPNAIRASMGAIFRVPVCEAQSSEVLGWLREQQFAIFAARVDGAIHYANADYQAKSAFVLGSEALGLSDAWRGSGITAVTLPMRGIVDSLNVSATAAVLCYEALRQRGP